MIFAYTLEVNIYYIVKFRGEGLLYSKYSEGEYLLYNKQSGGKVCYANGLLYDTCLYRR
jgi:hypothetical protein